MRATIDGWRLAPSVLNGSIHSGAKPTVKVSKEPEVVWNGNPYCEPGTVLYLPGYPGTGATIYDFSGQGNHGTITGATWTRLVSGLWVLSFDGDNDYVTVTNHASLQLAGKQCKEVWIYSDIDFNTQDAWARIIHKVSNPGTGNQGYQLICKSGTKRLRCSLFLNGAETVVDGDTDLVKDTWYHARVDYDQVNLAMYINDVSHGSTPLNTAVGVSAANVMIGGDAGAGLDFSGYIALPRICNNNSPGRFNGERHLFGV